LVPFNINLYLYNINRKNINEKEKMSENVNKNNKNNKYDYIFEMYNNFLTVECLQFLIKYLNAYLNISSEFIKRLMIDKKVNFLDIIFSNLKFYDNEFILQLLFFYNNKTTISTLNLKQQISNEKFKNLKF